MRRPRVRFTVRRMMVAVAVLGPLLGAALIAMEGERRSARYRALADYHHLQAEKSWTTIPQPGAAETRQRVSASGPVSPPEYPTPSRRYHADLADKYLQAAANPWLPVEPDPPEPK